VCETDVHNMLGVPHYASGTVKTIRKKSSRRTAASAGISCVTFVWALAMRLGLTYNANALHRLT
jgi:hypothetical protein